MTLDRYELFQRAFVVEDLDAAIEQWTRLLGAGPFVVSPHHRTDSFDYHGTGHQVDVSYAFGYLGDTMIQFIVQHDDTASICRDMYEPGEFGFHHSGVLVENLKRSSSASSRWASPVRPGCSPTTSIPLTSTPAR